MPRPTPTLCPSAVALRGLVSSSYGVESVPKICWSISVQRVVVEMHPAPTEGAFGTEGDPLEGAFGTQRVPH